MVVEMNKCFDTVKKKRARGEIKNSPRACPPINTECVWKWILQPIADRVAENLEIISEMFPTIQNSADEIYD